MIWLMTISLFVFCQTLEELKQQESAVTWLMNSYILEINGTLVYDDLTVSGDHMCIIELQSYYDYDLLQTKTKNVFSQYSDLKLITSWTYDIDEDYGKYCYIIYRYNDLYIMLEYVFKYNKCLFNYSSAETTYKNLKN
jgi:hypothetical protein